MYVLNTRVNRQRLEREGFDEVIGYRCRATCLEYRRRSGTTSLVYPEVLVHLSVIVLRSLVLAGSVLMCPSSSHRIKYSRNLWMSGSVNGVSVHPDYVTEGGLQRAEVEPSSTGNLCLYKHKRAPLTQLGKT